MAEFDGAAFDRQLPAAHAVLLHTPGLQLQFDKATPPPPPPAWLAPFLKALVKAFVAAFPVIRVLFWIGLAAAAAMILWLIVRDLPFARRWRRRAVAPAAPADWRPEAAAARALLQEADCLASEGRFDDAIHALLFRSIEDIAQRRPGAVRPPLTARDLVDGAPLSEDGRRAFRSIAAAVERSFFGGRAADADAFARCRAEYSAFALAEGAA